MFEFVGVRKKEHYLRKVAAEAKKSKKGEINFSSLTNQKYINNFAAPEINDFEDIVKDLKVDVEIEIEFITRDLDIDFNYSNLHEGQLSPTFDLCLSTKISNHDSLVVISSILPAKNITHKNVLLFTHDDGLITSFQQGTHVDSVFLQHSIERPLIISISSFKNINLKRDCTLTDLRNHFNKNVLDIIKNTNSNYFLGGTFAPNNPNFPDNIICFKLIADKKLPEKAYITILSKDLDFIFTTKEEITFWHNGKQITNAFVYPANQELYISFKIMKIAVNNKSIPYPKEMINEINSDGNLVFIHPDSV